MIEHFILKEKQIIPVDLMTWATWFEEGSNRRVALTKWPNGGIISTMFLGSDHNFNPNSKDKLLFETMAFDTGTEYDNEPYRYSTYEQAEKGHEEMVEMITKLTNATR